MFRPALVASLLLATPLVAQDTAAADEEPDAPAADMAAPRVFVRAGDIEAAVVYSLADNYDAGLWESGDPFGPVSGDWGEIGEVEDLVVDIGGQVVGVSVEVGGFLGIGEKTALIPLEDLRLVQRPEDEGFFIVTRLTNEQLEETPDVADQFVEAD